MVVRYRFTGLEQSFKTYQALWMMILGPPLRELIITHKSARKSVCIFKYYEQLYQTLPDGLYPWIPIALSSNEAANSSQHVDYLVYCRWFIWQRFIFVCHLVQDLPFIFI